MSAFHKAVSKRFIQAYYVLISEGRIKSQGVFAKRIKWSQPALSKALKGERKVPYEAAINFCTSYHISLIWMLIGKGNMLDENK